MASVHHIGLHGNLCVAQQIADIITAAGAWIEKSPAIDIER